MERFFYKAFVCRNENKSSRVRRNEDAMKIFCRLQKIEPHGNAARFSRTKTQT